MKVLLLAPRLDISFKHNPAIKKIPDKKPTKMPIRQHWDTFIANVIKVYSSRPNVEFVVEELPLWQFNQKVIDKHSPDLALIPHKEAHNFPVKNAQPYYYMQTTIPYIFSVDSKGWAGGASVYPYDSLFTEQIDYTIFNEFKQRIENNQSKFDQPKQRELNLPKDYILFACQITYDETIKWHSNVSVGKTLIKVCKATEKLGIPLVVKGHPINPDNMLGLKDSIKNYKHVTWLLEANIHQLIQHSRCVVVVNSGVGLEALLHEKPVVTFGRAEYDCVSNAATYENIAEVLSNLVYDKQRVAKFFDTWYNWCYDNNRIDTFNKLP